MTLPDCWWTPGTRSRTSGPRIRTARGSLWTPSKVSPPATTRSSRPDGTCTRPARPAPRLKRAKAANLLDRLDAEPDHVLRFAFDWRAPFDNNISEQAIRMAKIQQKISGGWRTAQGAQRYFAVRGYLSTAASRARTCSTPTGKPLGVMSLIQRISGLSQFFRDTAVWQ
ncbi:transposase [Kitasatospora aureofaciens]|uniref:IS66 family transposase n=1 Tax=Kitasatospora aureofaciens TaxID=1894 RepID=UPI0033E2599A